MTKTYILDFLKLHEVEMKEKYDVVKIGLFGSYARDNAHEDSDIDLYAEFENIFFESSTFPTFHSSMDWLNCESQNIYPILVTFETFQELRG